MKFDITSRRADIGLLSSGLQAWILFPYAKVATAIARMEQGSLSNVKSVGEGVLEYKINFGPGYRIYFGRDGGQLIILLTGGTKKRQQRDIDHAIAFWRDYKQTKRAARKEEGK